MKKGKLISTCVAATLILSLMAFGVYAALTTSFSISNKILFNASTDQAYFTSTLTTFKKADDEATTEWVVLDAEKTIKTDDSKQEATVTENAENTITDFDFSANQFYKITLVITNKNNEKNMQVTISNIPSNDNFTVTLTSNMTAIDAGSTELKADNLIAPGDSATIELTYEIVNYSNTFEVNQELSVEISVQ